MESGHRRLEWRAVSASQTWTFPYSGVANTFAATRKSNAVALVQTDVERRTFEVRCTANAGVLW